MAIMNAPGARRADLYHTREPVARGGRSASPVFCWLGWARGKSAPPRSDDCTPVFDEFPKNWVRDRSSGECVPSSCRASTNAIRDDADPSDNSAQASISRRHFWVTTSG